MSQMIIANRLIDGLVIYMGPKGEWVGSISEGAGFKNEQEAQHWLVVAKQAVEDSVVVDPYLIDIDTGGGKRLPAGARETIRAFGPSVRTDLLEAAEGNRG